MTALNLQQIANHVMCRTGTGGGVLHEDLTG